MTANPDALRRAADEMEAQSTRIGRLVADLRDRADKIHEVRLELGRAGFPVDEGAWPTDALRQLVDAHIALKAKPWSDAPITMALCSLLGDCRPAEIVDRVRNMKFDFGLAKEQHNNHYHHLARLREALDAANAGPADGTLVERVRGLARRIDSALSRAYRLESILAEHNGDKAPDDYAAFLRELLTRLTSERDGLARRLEAAELDRAGLVATTDTLRRERDGALTQMDHLDKRLGLVASQLERAEAERDDLRATLAKCHTACNGVGIAIRTDASERVHHMAAELAALREKVEVAKPTAPEPAWSSCCIHNAGRRIWLTKQGPNWHVSRDGLSPVLAADFSSALALEGLLAGHDPGGIWRVAGDPVTVAVVRAVCPTVAVSWGPA